MSDVPAVITCVILTIFCFTMGALTNRRFGHRTFFGAEYRDDACRPLQDTKMSRAQPEQQTCAIESSKQIRCDKDMSCFYDLPIGIMDHIASFMCPADLVRVATTSMQLHATSESALVWKEHCQRVFGDEAQRDQWLEQQLGKTMRISNIQHREDRCEVDFVGSNYREKNNNGNQMMRDVHQRRLPSVMDSTAVRNELQHPYLRHSSPWREAFFLAHAYRPRELLENAPLRSCLVMINRRVHDVTGFLETHPGGEMILREHASRDATDPFERAFHSREARRIARSFVVWDGALMMGRKGTLQRYAKYLDFSRGEEVSTVAESQDVGGSNTWLGALNRWTTISSAR